MSNEFNDSSVKESPQDENLPSSHPHGQVLG